MAKYLVFSSTTPFFSLEISQILENSKVVSVRGDGHCLIYAWEIALRASANSQFKSSYDILRRLIHMDFSKNLFIFQFSFFVLAIQKSFMYI